MDEYEANGRGGLKAVPFSTTDDENLDVGKDRITYSICDEFTLLTLPCILCANKSLILAFYLQFYNCCMFYFSLISS